MAHPPKRRFSQNFLRDLHVVGKILGAAELTPEDRVLEIGPGLGVLTWKLLDACRDLHVIEVDLGLVEELKKRREPRLKVIEGDALKMDWEALLGSPPWKLVANLPYNISSPLFFKILEHRFLFQRLVLMFQKEFGERLCALPGNKDYGIPSVFCRQYFDVYPVMTVSPRSFSPVPKVYSMVLCLTPLPRPRVYVSDENLFARVVKGAFAQRRKTLLNSLKGFGFEVESLAERITAAGIDPKRRGETLTLEEFGVLSTIFSE